MAERLSEVEADALLDDAEFQGLVEGYRRFMDLPAAERRERLVAIAFCELEAAALDGDIKVCCFLLKEDRLRRCPAETLADALEARMAALPEPPPPPRPGGVGPRSQPRRGPPLVRRGCRPRRRRDPGRPRRRTPPPDQTPRVRQPRQTRRPENRRRSSPRLQQRPPRRPADPVPSPPRRCSVASSSAAPPAWRSAPVPPPGTSMPTAPVPVAAPGAPKPRRASRHPGPSVLSVAAASLWRPPRSTRRRSSPHHACRAPQPRRPNLAVALAATAQSRVARHAPTGSLERFREMTDRAVG